MFRCITLRKSSQFERTFQTSVKVSLGPTAMRFTIDDKHLIKWMWVEKNYVEKRFLKMLLTEDEDLMG